MEAGGAHECLLVCSNVDAGLEVLPAPGGHSSAALPVIGSSRAWLLLWAVLITLPQLLTFLLKDQRWPARTARWHLLKDSALMGGLLLALAASLAVPFVPYAVSAGVDLTVFLLGIYPVVTELYRLFPQVSRARRLARMYSRFDRLCRPSALSDRDLRDAVSQPSVLPAFPPYFLTFRAREAQAQHAPHWNPSKKTLRMSSELARFNAVAHHGPRQELVAMYVALYRYCSSPYSISRAAVKIFTDVAGLRVFESSSDCIVRAALEAAGEADWLQESRAAHQSELDTSRLELSRIEGLLAACPLPVFEEIRTACLERQISSSCPHNDELLVQYDLAVLAAELVVISDYMCEASVPPTAPFAHALVDAFVSAGSPWRELEDAPGDPRGSATKRNLWLLWLAASMEHVPLLLVLVFLLIPGINHTGFKGGLRGDVALDRGLAVDMLAAIIRWSMASTWAAVTAGNEPMHGDAFCDFADSERLGLSVRRTRVAVSEEVVEQREMHGRFCTEAEAQAARLLLNMAMKHTCSVLGFLEPPEIDEGEIRVQLADALSADA